MLTDPDKRCGCGAGHPTWGACARAKNIRLGQIDVTQQKKWDARLGEMAECSKYGVVPKTTQLKDIRAAMERSAKTGSAFDSAAGF